MSPIWINRVRWNSILCGMVIFFWSGLEDNDLSSVSILALWLTISLTSLWVIQQFRHTPSHQKYLPILVMIIGAGMGILMGINMAGLMLFKNLRHSHFFPDYPFEMMRDIIARTPFWALAGMFIMLGIYLLATLFIQKSDS